MFGQSPYNNRGFQGGQHGSPYGQNRNPHHAGGMNRFGNNNPLGARNPNLPFNGARNGRPGFGNKYPGFNGGRNFGGPNSKYGMGNPMGPRAAGHPGAQMQGKENMNAPGSLRGSRLSGSLLDSAGKFQQPGANRMGRGASPIQNGQPRPLGPTANENGMNSYGCAPTQNHPGAGAGFNLRGGAGNANSPLQP